MFTTKIAWEPLRTLDSATLTGSMIAIGTPLEHPSFICKMVNDSDTAVTISIDGTTEIDVCPAGSFWLYDEYKTNFGEGLPAHTQFFVSGDAGTGNIYLVSQYLVQS